MVGFWGNVMFDTIFKQFIFEGDHLFDKKYFSASLCCSYMVFFLWVHSVHSYQTFPYDTIIHVLPLRRIRKTRPQMLWGIMKCRIAEKQVLVHWRKPWPQCLFIGLFTISIISKLQHKVEDKESIVSRRYIFLSEWWIFSV